MKKRMIHLRYAGRCKKPLRFNLYLILWFFIAIGTVCLLVRFSFLSYSREYGQEASGFKEVLVSYFSNKVIESGASLIKYTEDVKSGKEYPEILLGNRLAIMNFLTKPSQLVDKVKEYAPESNSTSSIVKKYAEEISLQELEKEEDEEQDRFQLQIDSKLKYHHISGNTISMEYILTNGTFYNDKQAAYYVSNFEGEDDHLLEIGSLYGNLQVQESEDSSDHASRAIEASNPGNVIEYTMEQLKDTSFLVRHFYIVDPATKVTESLFDAEKLLNKDMKLKQGEDAPQILIYHTHSQEAYIDSKSKKKSDTIVGVGSLLAQILEEQYGYNVIHDTSCYDIIDGVLNRNKAYNMAEAGIMKILEENPTIEVVIDLHRDGAAEKRTTIIDGEETAQIMLFNGLSRDQSGPIAYLENPYLQDNLAMSLQLQLKGIDLYPGLFYKNYLNCYRYNMHVRPKCILMELGTDKNTLQSAKNAMKPFAKVLNAVLRGE
jgi:stage II sporulation protein P